MAVVTAGWLEEGPEFLQSQDLGNLPTLLLPQSASRI